MHKLVTTDNAFIDARLNYETEECIYSVWYDAPTLLPTGATVGMEQKAVYTVKKCS